jgi:hypothetical protein
VWGFGQLQPAGQRIVSGAGKDVNTSFLELTLFPFVHARWYRRSAGLSRGCARQR